MVIVDNKECLLVNYWSLFITGWRLQLCFMVDKRLTGCFLITGKYFTEKIKSAELLHSMVYLQSVRYEFVRWSSKFPVFLWKFLKCISTPSPGVSECSLHHLNTVSASTLETIDSWARDSGEFQCQIQFQFPDFLRIWVWYTQILFNLSNIWNCLIDRNHGCRLMSMSQITLINNH